MLQFIWKQSFIADRRSASKPNASHPQLFNRLDELFHRPRQTVEPPSRALASARVTAKRRQRSRMATRIQFHRCRGSSLRCCISVAAGGSGSVLQVNVFEDAIDAIWPAISVETPAMILIASRCAWSR